MISIAEKLFTNRLLLRRITREDLELLFSWSRSAEAYGSFLSPEQHDLEELLQRYNSGLFWNNNEKVYLIEDRKTEPLGTIHYWFPSDKMETAVIALKIAKPGERNKGYGTEAQKFLMIHLFDHIKVQQVEMYSDLDNFPQQRCLKKLGFSLIETLTYDDNGIRRTGNLYRINHLQYKKEAIFRYHYE